MFTGRAKPIRIIGDPDNQHPDKDSSAEHTAFLWKNLFVDMGMDVNGVEHKK